MLILQKGELQKKNLDWVKCNQKYVKIDNRQWSIFYDLAFLMAVLGK